jgi:ATP-binding cassette, subfamily C, bacterial CydC
LFRNDPLIWASGLLRPRISRMVLAAALGAAALGSALTLAAVSAWLITRAWQMPPVLDLTVAVVAVRALGISRGVLGYCERLASHDVALRSAARARTELYRALVAAPADAVMRLTSGELLARLGASVDDLSDVLVRAVLPIIVATMLSAAAITTIAVIAPVAAVVLAGCLFVAGVVAPWLSARAASGTEQVAAEYHSARDAALILALEHAPELRVGGRLDDTIAEATDRQRDWGDAADHAARPAAVAAAAPTAAIGVSVLGAVLIGIAIAPTFAPTTLAILLLLPLSAFEATTALPAAATALTRARIAAFQLRQLTSPDAPSRVRPTVPPLDLRPGARVAVVGPSGCGKTTLLMAAAAESNNESRLTAGFFAEDAHVFDTTLRDNLLAVRGDARDSELDAALRRVGLGRWLDGLPAGLSTLLVGGAAALSAGQRRRLLLARAVLSNFPIVLLDEPTEHLDADDGRRILSELLTPDAMFGADRTVVVATHHLPDDVDCSTVSLNVSPSLHSPVAHRRVT